MANPLTAYKAWVVDNGAVVKKFEDTARMLTMFLPVNFHKQTPSTAGYVLYEQTIAFGHSTTITAPARRCH